LRFSRRQEDGHRINELNKVRAGLHSLIDEPLWVGELQKLARADHLNPLLSGYACALLVGT